jgi:hypothetical protein
MTAPLPAIPQFLHVLKAADAAAAIAGMLEGMTQADHGSGTVKPLRTNSLIAVPNAGT